MISLNWPIVLTTTVVLYVLILLTLPFGTVYSTLFLFALIAFWSRLPGVGIPQPFLPIIWVADLVDLFALIVSINLGGFVGGLLSVFANVWGRMCGIYPSWRFTFEDAGTQFVVCLMVPYIHIMTGGDIFMSMVVYTIIRGIILLPINFLLATVSYVQLAIEWITGVTAIFIINAIYARFFGNYFNGLMQKGVAFPWLLFLFATVVIIVFYLSVFGISKDKNSFSVKKIVKKRIKKAKEKKEQSKPKDNKEIDEMKRIKDMI